MKKMLLKKNLYFVLLIDLILFIFSFYFGFLLRFDFDIPEIHFQLMKKIIVPVVVTKMSCFGFLGLYRGMWRFVSIGDFFNIIKASLLSMFVIITYILTVYRFESFSRTVIINDLVITILLVSVFRVCIRFYFELFSAHKSIYSAIKSILPFIDKERVGHKKLLIIGAGKSGETIYREIRNNNRLNYRVIGFLDDHETKIGKIIHGARVLDRTENLGYIADEYDVDEVLIAIPSATAKQMRRLVNLCRKSGKKYKTIPGFGEIINGNLSVSSIREVAYRDLLGRKTIDLDKDKIGKYLNKRSVLVTGAGGSIGSELCRQICRFDPLRIILFERTESSLYEIDLELKQHFPKVDVVPHLADIQYPDQLEKTFSRFEPQIVFHAAAYKHVPMMEMHPWKAVKNNIMGTQNMLDVSKQFGVEKFVLVSTDKAVRPTSVMGASKRIAEMLVQNQNCAELSKTRFMTVRFGNVIGSSGSVIPLFKKQIAMGGPVTVTHPDANRFFMTIPESCQLILQAGSMSQGGEIYILDMGEPVNIASMARDLIRFSGFEPDEDIKIKYTGLRPGEKLYEELITEGEGIVETNHEKIMVLNHTECNINILKKDIMILGRLAKDQDKEGIIKKIMEIVPEYKPQKNEKKMDQPNSILQAGKHGKLRN